MQRALPRAPIIRGERIADRQGADAGVRRSRRSRTLAAVRLTEFWRRLEEALGEGYARSWAADFHITALGGLTVLEAIDAGIETVDIWRAAHAALGLPAALR
jgi:hypothetical protein